MAAAAATAAAAEAAATTMVKLEAVKQEATMVKLEAAVAEQSKAMPKLEKAQDNGSFSAAEGSSQSIGRSQIGGNPSSGSRALAIIATPVLPASASPASALAGVQLMDYQLEALRQSTMMINRDVASGRCRGMLLQGTLGSGKTLCALAIAKEVIPSYAVMAYTAHCSLQYGAGLSSSSGSSSSSLPRLPPTTVVTLVISPCPAMSHWRAEAQRLGGFDEVVAYYETDRAEKLAAALARADSKHQIENRAGRVLAVTSLATFFATTQTDLDAVLKRTRTLIYDESDELRNGDTYQKVGGKESSSEEHEAKKAKKAKKTKQSKNESISRLSKDQKQFALTSDYGSGAGSANNKSFLSRLLENVRKLGGGSGGGGENGSISQSSSSSKDRAEEKQRQKKSKNVGFYGWLLRQLNKFPDIVVLLLTGTVIRNTRMDFYHQLVLIVRSKNVVKELGGGAAKWQQCGDELYERMKTKFVVKMTSPSGGCGGGSSSSSGSRKGSGIELVGGSALAAGLDIRKVVHNHGLTEEERKMAIDKHVKVKQKAAQLNAARAIYPAGHPALRSAFIAFVREKSQYRRGFLHSAFFEPDVDFEGDDEWKEDGGVMKGVVTVAEAKKAAKKRRMAWLKTLDPEKSSKLVAAADAIVAFLREPENDRKNEKLAKFCEWVEPLILLQQLLAKKGVEAQTFFGGVTQKKRDAVLAAFNDKTDRSSRVLLLTSKTGGRALNLVAATHAWHLHHGLSPAEEDQCTGRVVRPPGQPDVKRWHVHYFETPEWATIDNCYLEAVHTYKQRQADDGGKRKRGGDNASDEASIATLQWAVPSLTLEEARQRMASSCVKPIRQPLAEEEEEEEKEEQREHKEEDEKRREHKEGDDEHGNAWRTLKQKQDGAAAEAAATAAQKRRMLERQRSIARLAVSLSAPLPAALPAPLPTLPAALPLPKAQIEDEDEDVTMVPVGSETLVKLERQKPPRVVVDLVDEDENWGEAVKREPKREAWPSSSFYASLGSSSSSSSSSGSSWGAASSRFSSSSSSSSSSGASASASQANDRGMVTMSRAELQQLINDSVLAALSASQASRATGVSRSPPVG